MRRDCFSVISALLFACFLGAEEEVGEWKRLEIKFSNETIVFFVTGTIEKAKEGGPNGDGWSGTGRIVGLDEKGQIRFSGRYVESKKDGEFASVSIRKNGREINLSSWKAGISSGSKIIYIPNGSSP